MSWLNSAKYKDNVLQCFLYWLYQDQPHTVYNIFVICSCSVCALSPHKNRSLLTGGRLVKASAHICGLCALIKKLFILFLFRATVAVAFKKIIKDTAL